MSSSYPSRPVLPKPLYSFLHLIFTVLQADRHGQTPLSFAARLGDVPTVAALLKHQADPSACDEFGCTPLHKAASWGHASALQLLLDHNVNAASPRRKPVDPNLRMQPTSCAPETRAVSLFEVRRAMRKKHEDGGPGLNHMMESYQCPKFCSCFSL